MEPSLIFEHRGFRFRSSAVYPRVRYFQARLQDVYTRFCRIVGNLPCHLFELQQLKVIEETIQDLRGPPLIILFGDPSLQGEHVVINVDALQEVGLQETSSRVLCPAVCHIRVPDVSTHGQEIVNVFLKKVQQKIILQSPPTEILKLFVVVTVTKDVSDPALNAFRLFTNGRIQQYIPSCGNYELLMSIEDKAVLPAKLCLCMEAKLVDAFDFLSRFLDVYVRKRGSKGFMSETPTVITKRCLKDIMNAPKVLMDYTSGCFTEEERQAADDELDALVSSFLGCATRQIKCCLAEYFSNKFLMNNWVINDTLNSLELERKLTEAVSKRNRLQLRGIVNSLSNDGAKMMQRTNDKLAILIAYDMDRIVKEVELKLQKRCTWCVSAGKMQHELEGYIRQSNVESGHEYSKTSIDVPELLRQDLARIKEVFGFGSIDNKFEIHLKSNTCASEIQELLKKHQFKHDYSIKIVSQNPSPFAIQFEGGNGIKCNGNGRCGTLGVFLQDPHNVPYMTTCGHVVVSQCQEDVLIKEGNTMVKFATSDPALTLTTGNSHDTLVDIAVAKVEASMTDRCMSSLRNEEGVSKPVIVDQSLPGSRELDLPFVYKYGGVSRRTFGRIADSNYTIGKNTLFNTGSVIYIEDPPGGVTSEADNQLLFAEPGDSGAAICGPDPDGQESRVIAVVLGGKMTFEHENEGKYFACLFHKSISAIEEKANMNFRVYTNDLPVQNAAAFP